MSYDIRLVDAQGETINFNTPHQMTGGTFAVGGTTEAWLNVTYNYSKYFYRVLGEKGIRTIYGMTAQDSIEVPLQAADKLVTDVHQDYWEPTEGNARKVLIQLSELARMAPPNSIWQGD